MAIDPIKLKVLAEEKSDENWRFRQSLKTRCRLDPDELDQRVFELTQGIWADIDCTTCANCCKTVRPTFSDADVAKLAQRLQIEPAVFIDTYLNPNESGEKNPWIARSTPCAFLKDNRCSVYDDRPADCRGYPYLQESGFVFRLMAMIDRTSTCPIVFEVMEALKPSVGFGRRKGL